jgi:integrase
MTSDPAPFAAAVALRLGVSVDALVAAIAEARAETAPRTRLLISTQAQAEAAGPGVHRVRQAVGVYLKKGAAGAQSGSWFRRYWFAGRRRCMGLGALAKTTLAQALRKAREFDVERDKGDPLELRRAARVGATLASERWTFAQAAESYVAAHAPEWKHPRAKAVWLNPIVRYAYPVIGRMLLDDIRVEHVDAVMTAAVAGGAPKVAPRIRLRIEQVFNAAAALGKRDASRQNPAGAKLIKAVRPTKAKGPREHFRRLDLDAAPKAFQRLVEAARTSTPLSALAFMVLTAARPSEALGAQWSEIDIAKRVWTVPGERMKSGKSHVVPLSGAALAVIARQEIVRTGDAVFPSDGGSPVSYGAFSASARKLPFDLGAPHSWRSIFRDTAEDVLGFPPHIAEAALAHSLGGVAAAYRRETGVEQRRGLMAAYAAWLMGEAADNVVALKTKMSP